MLLIAYTVLLFAFFHQQGAVVQVQLIHNFVLLVQEIYVEFVIA